MLDKNKTLEELENSKWEPDPKHTTNMVVRCHQLRRVPLRNLTPDDCRLLLGQKIGAKFLVPLAVEWLNGNPLLEASAVPGDLLMSVLRQDAEFWRQHPDLWWQVQEIVTEVEILFETLENDVIPATKIFQNGQP